MNLIDPLNLLDWTVIVAFFVVTLGIGLAFSKRATSSISDYFVAGRKMHWFIAGTSIVATSFASDTPLVISGWIRTIGLDRNWFWWGSIMGTVLCAFFFARMWRRAKVMTDIEFNEMRYHGRPAAGLRMFQAGYRSLIANTLTMGWVTLAMAKILDVTLNLPTLVFMEGEWAPILVAKGVDITTIVDMAQIADWPLLGQAIIPAKATGIILCLLTATLYTVFSGLWGVMATDVFQFTFAMTGTILLMIFVMVYAGGPQSMVTEAKESLRQGRVVNKATLPREQLPVRVVTDLNMEAAVTKSLFEPVENGDADVLFWKWKNTTELYKDFTERVALMSLSSEQKQRLTALWSEAFTIKKVHFTDSFTVERLLEAKILLDPVNAKALPLDYYRFADIAFDDDAFYALLDNAGITDKSEAMAAWRRDKVVSSYKITSLLPPFDLKGGGLMAVWALVVFLGLQWWASGAGEGFLVQRLFSSKNEEHSVKAMLWYNMAHFVLRPWPWIVVGIASLFLIPDVTAYGKHYDEEYAYIIILMNYMPAGLKGMMVAALMAAYMSTISTHVNFGASYIVNDLYKRFIRPNASSRGLIYVSQVVSFFLALLAGIYAYLSNSIASGWLNFFELTSGMALVILLRWYWWRINVWSEISAMAISLSIFILIRNTSIFHSLFSSIGLPASYLDEYPVRFTLNILLSTFVWISVTFLTRPEPEKHLIAFYKRIRPPGWWQPIKIKAQIENPLQVGRIEWVCWLLGVTGLFAMIFAIGKLCFGLYGQGGLFGIYGLAAMIVILKLIRRMDWSEIHEDES